MLEKWVSWGIDSIKVDGCVSGLLGSSINDSLIYAHMKALCSFIDITIYYQDFATMVILVLRAKHVMRCAPFDSGVLVSAEGCSRVH